MKHLKKHRNFQYCGALGVLNRASLNIGVKRSSEDHLLLIQCYYSRKPKLTQSYLYMDSYISSKLCFQRSSKDHLFDIDPVLLLEKPKLNQLYLYWKVLGPVRPSLQC